MNNIGDKQRKALGKGLSALLPGRSHATAQPLVPPNETPAAPTSEPPPILVSGPLILPVGEIQANPLQPRSSFRAVSWDTCPEEIIFCSFGLP